MNSNEILGDYSKRYFGAGHKASDYNIIENNGENMVGCIKQNGVWSEKNNCVIQQHLSTIDGIIMAAMFIDRYVSESDIDINAECLFLREFEIKASSSPIENMDKINISLKEMDMDDKNFYFNILVEGMDIKLHFIKNDEKIANVGYNTSEEFYSNHMKYCREEITDIAINGSDISCNVEFIIDENKSYSGLQSINYKYQSIIAWLIVFSQMGQILAYNIDSLNREDTNTMWMKNVKAKIKEPKLNTFTYLASGGVTKSRILNIKDKKWRKFTMAGYADYGNVYFEGSIAHELPEEN